MFARGVLMCWFDSYMIQESFVCVFAYFESVRV